MFLSIDRLRNSLRLRVISLVLLLSFSIEFLNPTALFAIGGPSQVENLGFSSGGGNMVDFFSGDFKYDIPLMNVGGYPINLSYSSDVSMDQEASVVGLGWNISSHGVINRSVRGLADDYDGEKVKTTTNIKPNITMGLTLNLKPELFNIDLKKTKAKKDSLAGNLKISIAFTHNNYNGFSVGLGAGLQAKLKKRESMYRLGLGLNSTADGFDLNASVTAGEPKEEGVYGGFLGASVNNMGGLRANAMQSLLPVNFGNFGIGTRSYFPQKTLAYRSVSGSFSFSPELTVFGAENGIEALISYNRSEIKKNKQVVETEAYGYLYHETGADKDKVLLDFNNSNQDAIVMGDEGTKNLPLTQMMYDIYSVQGHGVGGSFRPHFAKSVEVYPTESNDESYGASGHLELGAGAMGEAAWGVSGNGGYSNSGPWNGEKNNLLSGFQVDNDPNNGRVLNETVYFKRIGETTSFDRDYLASIGADNVIYPKENALSLDHLVRQKGGNALDMNQSYRLKRDKRKQVVTPYTNDEVNSLLNYQVEFYEFNSDTSKMNPHRSGSQIGAFKVRSGDGSVYTYGLPLYSSQDEVSFNAEGLNVDCTTGLVAYQSKGDSADNSVNNDNGINNYFQKREIPEYAHAYMLTEIKSADYQDIDNNGISEADFGTAYKFNYYKTDNVKWRLPFEKDQANFAEGFHTDQNDDMASYVYGQKDQAYLHSLESKTHIAVFHYKDRYDGVGVLGENGGIDTSSRSKALVKIELFTKNELNEANPVPEKTVHFRYDYSLCKGIPNYDQNIIDTLGIYSANPTLLGGKLTLKQVYFTYKSSEKGALNPYEFYYADADHDKSMETALNPNYDFKAYDRWGNYKENPLTDPDDCFRKNSDLSNAENPYTAQGDDNKEQVDKNAQAWLLSTIDLPTGATMEVDYESDDYAYVQTEMASEMMTPIGFSTSTTFTGSNLLYNSDKVSQSYVFFDLKRFKIKADNVTDANTLFKERYLGRNTSNRIDDEIYFNCYTKLNRSDIDGFGEGAYEFVKGYAKLDLNLCGVDPSSFNSITGEYERAYIKMLDVSIKKNGKGDAVANAISKAGWQMCWQFLRPLIIPGSENISLPDNEDEGPSEEEFKTFFNAVKGRLTSAATLFKSYYKVMREKDVAKEVVLEKSFFRLKSPDMKKLGGGVRVKRILVKDNWGDMSQMGESNLFGQEYSYTKTLDNGMEVSSGVSSWEPFIGGDENTNKRLINKVFDRKVLATNDGNNSVAPLGELFYSSGSVGYSKVTVRAINPDSDHIVKHGTGRTVHEFYTAKDFPTIVNYSAINSSMEASTKFPDVFAQLRAVQGYTMEFNDMHGKLKAKKTYAENSDAPISAMIYKYNVDENNPSRLSNEVDFLTPQNQSGVENSIRITPGYLGLDVDVTYYHSRSNFSAFSAGFENQTNLIPLLTPFIVPSFGIPLSYSKESFRMGVITKMVNRQGILKEIVVIDETSKTTISNELWDEETGNVLLTKSVNEFEDPLFKLEYPAYWAYEGLGPHYKNVNASFSSQIGDNGKVLSSLASQVLNHGDIVKVSGVKAWVLVSGSNIQLIDKDGSFIPNSSETTIRVLKSGLENLTSATVQSVSMKENPIVENGGNKYILVRDNLSVINASAAEFSDHWQGLIDLGGNTDFIRELVTAESVLALRSDLIGRELETYQWNILKQRLKDLMDESRYIKAQNLGDWYSPYDLFDFYNCGTASIDLPCDRSQFKDAPKLQEIYVHPETGRYYVYLTINTYSGNPAQVYAEIVFSNSDCFTLGRGSYTNGVFTEGPFEGGELSSGEEEEVINPFVQGVQGNWSSKRSFVYRDARASSSDIRFSGTMESRFEELWTVQSGQLIKTTSNKWISAMTNTKRSPYGFQIESKDPLDRYVSSHVGFDNNLIIGQAVNSNYNSFFNLGFEDYNTGDIPELLDHVEMVDLSTAVISYEESHTGKNSLEVGSSNFTITTNVSSSPGVVADTDSRPLSVDDTEVLGKFSPLEDNTYLVTYWMKSSNRDNAGIQVYVDSVLDNTSRKVEVMNVEGWSMFTQKFYIPCGAGNVSISTYNNNSDNVYFDDIRFQPYDSEVISYVYDNKDYKLLAELDAQNFATFYEYDEENTLVRIKKETSRGIYTITESRSGLRKLTESVSVEQGGGSGENSTN